MTTDNSLDHVFADFRHIVGLPDADRIAFLDQPRWISYPLATRMLDTLRGLMEKPTRPRMPSLLIVGESNNGKTTLIRRFTDLHGVAYVDTNNEPVKPVILVESPPSADEKGLYIAILERFFTPYRASDPAAKLRYQVIHLLHLCKTRVLIIDEFHSLLAGTAIKQREVMNTIKLLCNELSIPIVGVGTREAVRVLHTDPQHASRFDVISMPLWELNPDFQRLLHGFEKVLPLRKPSELLKPEMATALHAISGGNIGNVHRLIVECAIEAIRSKKECIDLAIVKSKAWVKPTRGIREVAL